MSHCCSKPAIIYITSNSVTDRLDLNSFQFRIPHSGIIEPVMEFSSAEWIEINIDNEKKKFVESEKKKKIPHSEFRIPHSGIIQICHEVQFCPNDRCKIH